MKTGIVAVIIWAVSLMLPGVEPVPLGTHEVTTLSIGAIAWGEITTIPIDVECLPGRIFVDAGVSCGCLHIRRIGGDPKPNAANSIEHFTASIDPLYRVGKTGLLVTFHYSNGDKIPLIESAVVQIAGEVKHRVGIELREPVAKICSGLVERLPDSVHQGDEMVIRVTHGGVNAQQMGNVLVHIEEGSPWAVVSVTRLGIDPVWDVRLRLDASSLLGGLASAVLIFSPQDELGKTWTVSRELSINASMNGKVIAEPHILVWHQGDTSRVALSPLAFKKEKDDVIPEIRKVVIRDEDRQLMITLNAQEVADAQFKKVILTLVRDPQVDLGEGFSGVLRMRSSDRQIVFQLPLAIIP